MSVLNVKPKFLYPHSRQFPFDEVAEKIVKAMEKRNWKVPGITVQFYTYGSGEAKYKKVNDIKGENFRMHFCRKQGSLDGNWNDTAALNEVYIPKQSLTVYSDESGPTYHLYVGKEWEKEKEWFMNSIKVHSKLDKEPRRYLRYSGNTYNQRATELVHDADLGREYSPIGSEPQIINLEDKFKEIVLWLEKFVLAYILNFPEQDADEETINELLPYNGPWPVVFSFCDCQEAERIIQGKENSNELPLEDRHAYFGFGPRLVPLSAKGEEQFPEIAYEGFIWCDVNQEITQNSKKNDISPCIRSEMRPLSGKGCIVAIKLKYANDIYVAENAKYEETRSSLFDSIAPRERLTDDELDKALIARGATIVPITKYKGNYKEPIVLINRELDFEEIEYLVNVD